MKKVLLALCLLLTLCIVCSTALASAPAPVQDGVVDQNPEPAGEEPAGEEPAGEEPAGEEPAGEEPAGEEPAGEEPAEGEHGHKVVDGKIVHNFTISEPYDEKVFSWPTKNNPDGGLIRFKCDFAGEYEDTNVPGYLPEAVDFQEYVVYPFYNDFYSLDEALANLDDKNIVKDYYLNCVEDGYVTVYRKPIEGDQYIERDGVLFRGWKGAYSKDDTFTYTVKASGHKWSELEKNKNIALRLNLPFWTEAKAPTCTEKGLLQSYCLICKVTREVYKETDMLDHTWGDEQEYTEEATCKDPGYYKKYQLCTVCGEENILEEEELATDETKHVFGDWLVDEENSVAPTCTETGTEIRYRLCKVCLLAKQYDEQEVEALGHDWEIIVATCKENNGGLRKCKRCGLEEDYVDPDAHPFEAWEEQKDQRVEPTCTETGKRVYKCINCGAERIETIPALGHKWDAGVYMGVCGPEEEDQVAAYMLYTCTRDGCDATMEDPEDPADRAVPDHVWTPWTCRNTYNQGDADTPAYWIRQCAVCGKHQEKILNSSADLNDPTVDPDDPTTLCEHVWDYENIEVVTDPTCTEVGAGIITCAKCGKSVDVEIPAKDHTAEVIPAVPSTCTEHGLTAGSKCSVCGEILTAQEEAPLADHQPVDVEEVAPTCTEPGKAVGKVCSVCGEVLEGCEEIPAAGHTWSEEIEVVVEPTAEAPGKGVKKCTVCGAEEEAEIEYVAPELPDAEYGIEIISANDSSVTVKVTHVEGTQEAAELYVRVTLYTQDNTYLVTNRQVKGDTVDIPVGGALYAVTVQLTAEDSVVPGHFTAMDSDAYFY